MLSTRSYWCWKRKHLKPNFYCGFLIKWIGLLNFHNEIVCFFGDNKVSEKKGLGYKCLPGCLVFFLIVFLQVLIVNSFWFFFSLLIFILMLMTHITIFIVFGTWSKLNTPFLLWKLNIVAKLSNYVDRTVYLEN